MCFKLQTYGIHNDCHRIPCKIKEPQITVFRQTVFTLFSAGCTNVVFNFK